MADFRSLVNEYASSIRVLGKVNGAAFAAGVASVRDSGAKLDARIHALGMAAIAMAMPSDCHIDGASNAEAARQLVVAMPKISRAKTLADWFAAHSNIRLKFDKKTGEWKCGLAKKDSISYLHGEEKLNEAMTAADAKPFFAVDEVTAGPRAFDFNAGFSSFILRAAKALGNDNPKVQALLAVAEEEGVTVTLPAAKAA